MGRRKEHELVIDTEPHSTRSTPAAKESQLIALAYEEVERRLRDGTATSQETTYFLKLGSTNAALERREQEARIKKLEAQVEAMESMKNVEALYREAIQAVRSYGSPVTMGGQDRHE